MSESQKNEQLLTAAQNLDEELQRFGRLVQDACRGQIGSQKEIERTAKAIQDATAAVSGIDAMVQALARAIAHAQTSQQEPIDRLRDRAELLRQRYEEHEALKTRFGALAAEAAALTKIAEPLSQPTGLEVDLATPMTAIKERLQGAREGARTLMQDARTLHFEEVAREVHRFEQIVTTLERKLAQTEQSLIASKGRVQS